MRGVNMMWYQSYSSFYSSIRRTSFTTETWITAIHHFWVKVCSIGRFNYTLHEIARVLPHKQRAVILWLPSFQASFLAGNQTRSVVILLLLQNGWKLSQFALQDEILQLKTQKEIIKSLAVQLLKKFEERCIHHFNLIKYLVPVTMSVLWITSFGKLMERPRPKCKKL